MDIISMSNAAILQELAGRIKRHRVNLNITQADLAHKAGVARSMVQKFEMRGECRLSGLIRILRALGALDQLDAFLPDPGVSPLILARTQGKQRLRASKPRGHRTEAA